MKTNTNKLHGILSLCLIIVANIIGLASILSVNLDMGLIYLAILLISLAIITYSYCSKCPCRLESCAHVFPGKLTKFFPKRKPGSYTLLDISGVLVPMLVMTIFPQFWLWQNKIYFVLFWTLQIIAFIEIKMFVCKQCKNKYCPLSH